MTRRVRRLFETGGEGFRDLAFVQVASTMHDTLVAVGLAGTLFFGVPSTEARTNVALYLLLTVAPFAVIGPVLGRTLRRSPLAVRTALVVAAAGRGVLAALVALDPTGWWLFPAAFGLLLLSRVHAITRHALLPIALDSRHALVAANGRLAWIGTLAGGVAGALGALVLWLAGAWAALGLASLAAFVAAWLGRRLPDPEPDLVALPPEAGEVPRHKRHLPPSVRAAQLSTAVVRGLNGFLLLLLAFAFHQQQDAWLDFGALLAAGGAGFALASLTAPVLERRLREEPMVVAALAVEAAAAFLAGQAFGLLTGAVLALAAGFAWGTAKLAFDGLLQGSVEAERRGVAFTRSETMFAIAWVVGAVIPTAIPLPTGFYLAVAGFVALTAQVLYVGRLVGVSTDRENAAADDDGTVDDDAPDEDLAGESTADGMPGMNTATET
ncbi:hypothetical protein [Egicoccus halophilus]|uniref:MFS transporter n=1 Tax=Egicoccus halophilus TaxID=1670830 RepID=A0A8J3EUP0_9ACTN|nr:hypothetical protein [Egicoccus halophilus]GGI08084.1 hypothetical protein GCM10011354_27330 [Egicoccus halophilus]